MGAQHVLRITEPRFPTFTIRAPVLRRSYVAITNNYGTTWWSLSSMGSALERKDKTKTNHKGTKSRNQQHNNYQNMTVLPEDRTISFKEGEITALAINLKRGRQEF